jgi:integrase
MQASGTSIRHGTVLTGHLQVRGEAGRRRYFASWWDREGVRHMRKLGAAHVKDSGRRTPRGAVIWRPAPGPCPAGSLTPKMAEQALEEILDQARDARTRERAQVAEPAEAVPTFGDAVDAWLNYLEVEKRRKRGTIQDARNVARANLLPHFGRDTPLYANERHEVMVRSGGRERVEIRFERRDTFVTEQIDDYRRELLASDLSPRTAQKILVLLHGVFKLAKRRKLITSNPSEDAERITVDDPGTFNILEPVEFEAVYRAVLLQEDARPENDRPADAIDDLDDEGDRELYGALLSTAFYAGLRLGEQRDLPWRNVDFVGSMIRVESGHSHGERSTPKGKRARSTPMVPVLAQRLAALADRDRFTGEADYVFSGGLGERVGEAGVRKVFYAALTRAGLGHRREAFDTRGNPQAPIRVHDLRHSWCTWAVNVWPLTKVQVYAGHRDIKTTQRYVHHQTKAQDADLGGAYLDSVLAQGVLAQT